MATVQDPDNLVTEEVREELGKIAMYGSPMVSSVDTSGDHTFIEVVCDGIDEPNMGASELEVLQVEPRVTPREAFVVVTVGNRD